jgi:hypothetical protein
MRSYCPAAEIAEEQLAPAVAVNCIFGKSKLMLEIGLSASCPMTP